MLVVRAVGVEELHGAGTEDLEAVVEVCARSQVLGAEAGAGIVDLDELDGLSGVVGDRRFDVRGVAAEGRKKNGTERECGQETHTVEDIRVGWA